MVKSQDGTDKMKKDERTIQRITLGELMTSFEHQAIAMPMIAERFLTMEGRFSKKEVDEAKAIYQDIMETKVDGKNLTVCQLAAMYLNAELALQRMNLIAADSQQPIPVSVSHQMMYG